MMVNAANRTNIAGLGPDNSDRKLNNSDVVSSSKQSEAGSVSPVMNGLKTVKDSESSASNEIDTTTSVSVNDNENENTSPKAHHHNQYQHHSDHLSRTNLYIRGLPANTSDENLFEMCSKFGHILSTKAIADKATGLCKGYGFVEFENAEMAEVAVKELTKSGIQAQMARVSPSHSSNYHHRHHGNHHTHSSNHQQHHNNSINSNSGSNTSGQQHNFSNNNNSADPTNLYIANLPPNMSEQELENLLSTYGPVVSTRILRDQDNVPRGVGFARMESRDKCEQIIEQLNGRPYKVWMEPLLVKFADSGRLKKRHHMNYHHHQHHNNNLQHHKIHQDDSRWRDNSNVSDLGSVPNFDRQNNISHSNHLTDLAMINTLGYPRMPAVYPPVPAGGPYPSPLGPPTSAPQWIHPGGQPYVLPQQMIRTGSLGPSNQAAAAAALHYGHIPQLTSQMQGLQIAHSGATVGGYLPPQYQWPPILTHPHQPPMRLPSQMQQPSPVQPPQPPSQQHSPHPPSMPQQQLTPPTQQQNLAADEKL